MIDTLRREGIYLWFYVTVLLKQIAPYWATGILLGSVISVFGKKRIHRLFQNMQHKQVGIWGVIPASLLGMASPICMYGTIPIAASFSEKGMRHDWLASFMMSSILLNPQLIIYSAALGRTALIIRIGSCFIYGIAAGICVRLFNRKKPFFDFSRFSPPESRDTDPATLMRLLKNVWRNIRATTPYFLLAIVLTALFQRYVPADVIAGLFGSQRGFGVLMAATLGVPLYVCGGGTIPLLMEWMRSGMGMGAAAAFMITGPATKLTNLGAVKIVLGSKRFALYILYAVLFALLTGVLIDLFS